MSTPIVFEWQDAREHAELDDMGSPIKDKWGDILTSRINERCDVHFDKRIKDDSPLALALKQCKGVDTMVIHDTTLSFKTGERIGTYRGELFRSKAFEREEVEDAIFIEYMRWKDDQTVVNVIEDHSGTSEMVVKIL